MTMKDDKLKTGLKKKKRQPLINIMFSSAYILITPKAKSLFTGKLINYNKQKGIHIRNACLGLCTQTMSICRWMI